MPYILRTLDADSQLISELGFAQLSEARDAYDTVVDAFRPIVRDGHLEHITVQLSKGSTGDVLEETTLVNP